MDYYYQQHMINGQNHDNGWGMVMMLIMAALLAAGVVLIVKVLTNRSQVNNVTNTDPIDIIKARYAKGEIDKAQFEQIKKDLK